MALQHTEQEIIVTVAPRVGKYHELAEAIRRGCLQSVEQCFGRERKGRATCAYGAAKLGGYSGSLLGPQVICPECHDPGVHFGHRLGYGPEHVAIILHLNDDHRWARERIADWLDTL